MKIYSRMETKYKSRLLLIRLPFGRRVLLVNDNDTLIRVLENSPEVYGPPGTKVRGMSVFQPNAVTISLAEDWVRRRAANEKVIESASSGSLTKHIDKTVVDIATRTISSSRGMTEWSTVSTAMGQISRQLIFGESSIDDEDLTKTLQRMMRRANWLIFKRKDRDIEGLIERILHYAEQADPNSLVGHFQLADKVECVEMCHQVPHWMFAMNDTLSENVIRVMAILAAHPDLLQELRKVNDAERRSKIDAVISETMRLFPSSTTIGRVTLTADILGNQIIPSGVQVLALTEGWHRDPVRFEDPSRFDIARPKSSVRIDHLAFGGGSQNCAGEHLARRICLLFIEAAILSFEFSQRTPTFRNLKSLPPRLNPFRIKLEVLSRPKTDSYRP